MNANTNQNALQPSTTMDSLEAARLFYEKTGAFASEEGLVWHEAHGLWFGGEGYAHVLNADGTPADNNSDLWKKCGLLAFRYTREKEKLPLQVLQSNAGFYIGTVVSSGDMRGAPNTRESDRYWKKAHEAQSALETGNWVQKQHL